MAESSLTFYISAALGGILPSLLWLWFWLGKDTIHPEPRRLLAIVYFVGALGAMALLPLRGVLSIFPPDSVYSIFVFAVAEEIIKIIPAMLIIFRSRHLDESTDYVLYFVTAALGFSALENTLYLVQAITHHDLAFFLLAGNMRFLGATVLHLVTVTVVGLCIGFAYQKKSHWRIVLGILGLGLGSALHTLFNWLILIDTDKSILGTFAGLWIVGILILIVFGKLNRTSQSKFV